MADTEHAESFLVGLVEVGVGPVKGAVCNGQVAPVSEGMFELASGLEGCGDGTECGLITDRIRAFSFVGELTAESEAASH